MWQAAFNIFAFATQLAYNRPLWNTRSDAG